MAGGSILGTRVQRKEDPKFLTSGGVYADDLDDPRLAGAAQAVYVRSTVAHGVIDSIETDDAVGMPGVLAVHTAETLGLEPVADFSFSESYVLPPGEPEPVFIGWLTESY